MFVWTAICLNNIYLHVPFSEQLLFFFFFFFFFGGGGLFFFVFCFFVFVLRAAHSHLARLSRGKRGLW